MFSRFFIDRPIFAAVISLFIMIAGLAAMRSLPVAQYPEIAPPIVTVVANFPGASAAVVEKTVAAPLETQINGVEGMLFMSSTSASNGRVEIYVTFEIGSDIDQAVLNVNNRVKQAEARLPEEVRRQGIIVEKGSSSFLQVIAFLAPDGRYDDLYTSNYVTLNVLDVLKRIPGTTNVQIFGAKDYAMRIWIKSDRLAQLKLTPNDLTRAITEQNAQYAVGRIGEPPTDGQQELTLTVNTQGRLTDVDQFENIVIRANSDGSMLRLKDVARVELGSKDYGFVGRENGQPATLVGIFLKPGANALDVAGEVKDTLRDLATRFPAGLEYKIPYDTTLFVEISIREVLKTLAEAMTLVFIVVFVFLQSFRATLIPMLVVPVALIGTFAGLLLLGYTINTLTLFGMVLAIGIVVDDAIVVMENIERIMREYGLPARAAAIKAMEEVTGPVVAIVLVLCAVFIPIAFLGGLAGELYRQFAVTLSIAVAISGLVALTLTPSLCVLFLKPHPDRTKGFFGAFNRAFGFITNRYTAGVIFMMRRGFLGLLLFGSMLFLTMSLWKMTPGSLVPDEDQGFFIVAVYLPDGTSLNRTEKIVRDVDSILRKNPVVEHSVAFTGFDFIGGSFKTNAATMFIVAKHWDQRKVSAQELVGETYFKTGHIKEAMILAFNPPAIFGLGSTGGFEFYLQNRGEGGPKQLAEVTEQLLNKFRQDKSFMFVNTLWRPNVPQLYVEVDRERAKALGVPINDIFDTLSAMLGTYYVNDFNKYGRSWQVLLSAEGQYRKQPQDIDGIYVRSDKGEMIPLSVLTRVRFETGPETLERYNNLPAAKILGSGVPGMSSGQTMARVEQIVRETLPPEFTFEWSGASFQEQRSGGTSGIALILGALMVFLILAAQYERWSLPLAVLLALPFAAFGALAALFLRSMSNDIYFQIGLITLFGLAAKNAILIVEYAIYKHKSGVSAAAAAIEAARLRFRPILMTSLAFILGVAPLAYSVGAGAGARRAVGTGVMGGMMAATFLAIFFIPLFYRIVSDRKLREKRSKQELLAEVQTLREHEHQKTAMSSPPLDQHN